MYCCHKCRPLSNIMRSWLHNKFLDKEWKQRCSNDFKRLLHDSASSVVCQMTPTKACCMEPSALYTWTSELLAKQHTSPFNFALLVETVFWLENPCDAFSNRLKAIMFASALLLVTSNQELHLFRRFLLLISMLSFAH